MTAARDADPVATIGGALFAENGLNEQAGPVLVRDVDFASTCAHTLLPFYGRIHVAYLPRGGVVVGLSKVARVVQSLSKRLQTPEDLARGAAEALERAAGAAGVAVVAVFRHLARPAGLRSEVVIERTGAFAGKDPARWAEVVSMLRVGGVVLPFGSPAGEDASERSSASSDTMAVDMRWVARRAPCRHSPLVPLSWVPRSLPRGVPHRLPREIKGSTLGEALGYPVP